MVEDFWEEKGKSGFRVYRCKLVRMPGQPPIPVVDPSERKKRKYVTSTYSSKKSKANSFDFSIPRTQHIPTHFPEEEERVYMNFEEEPIFASMFNTMLKGICFSCNAKVPGLAAISQRDSNYFSKLIDHLSDDLQDLDAASLATDGFVSPVVTFSMINQANLRFIIFFT